MGRLFRKHAGLQDQNVTCRAVLPEGNRIYAIGDVHGRADLLMGMRDLIAADLLDEPVREPLIVFTGDYVDRGPASKEVIEMLARRDFPAPIVTLMGNHEAMLLRFLEDADSGESWCCYGGLETLHSYGVEARGARSGRGLAEVAKAFRERVPEQHLEFLGSLPLTFMRGDYFFVHAGVRPGVPLEKQRSDDLLWIREEFTASGTDFGKVVVHGHHAVPEPELRYNRINVDTGAYISNRLTCLVAEGGSRKFLSAYGGRRPATVSV